MLRSVASRKFAFSLSFALLIGGKLLAQSESVSTTPDAASAVTLAEVVRRLPDFAVTSPGKWSRAVDQASEAERDTAVPQLIGWLKDERGQVRGLALLTLSFMYMPPEAIRKITCDRYLPVEYMPIVVANLKDIETRSGAFLALGSVERCGHGLADLVQLVLPMLREPNILAELPDPFFIESDRRMLATMTPEQQVAFKAHPAKTITLPATGPLLLSIVTGPEVPQSAQVDDAIIEFLRRPEQTKSTLSESMHIIALSHASERVNDAVLQQVFAQKAMSVFLLQFVSRLRLTPEQMLLQKRNLAVLAGDTTQGPGLRRAAAMVEACWDGRSTGGCMPTSEDFQEDRKQTSN